MALGVTMIEILCSDGRDSVSISRPPLGPLRIHVGTQHGLDHIMAAVGDQLSADEAAACQQLWADDASEREFRQTPEGMLFTLPSA